MYHAVLPALYQDISLHIRDLTVRQFRAMLDEDNPGSRHVRKLHLFNADLDIFTYKRWCSLEKFTRTLITINNREPLNLTHLSIECLLSDHGRLTKCLKAFTSLQHLSIIGETRASETDSRCLGAHGASLQSLTLALTISGVHSNAIRSLIAVLPLLIRLHQLYLDAVPKGYASAHSSGLVADWQANLAVSPYQGVNAVVTKR